MKNKSNYVIWARLLFFSFCKLDNSNRMKKKNQKRGDVRYLATPAEALHLGRGCSTPISSQYITSESEAAAAARPLTLSILILEPSGSMKNIIAPRGGPRGSPGTVVMIGPR